MFNKCTLISMLVVIVLIGGIADAGTIAVPDASFEDHVLVAEDDYVYLGDPANTGPWDAGAADAGAWLAYNYYYPGAPEWPARTGKNKVYGNSDYFWQVLNDTYIESQTYTFSAWAGTPWSGYGERWYLYLAAEDNIGVPLAEANGSTTVGSWEQVSVEYTATAADAGKKIVLRAWTDQYMAVDDVTLSFVPEPSTMAMTLLGLGALGFCVYRRRKR